MTSPVYNEPHESWYECHEPEIPLPSTTDPEIGPLVRGIVVGAIGYPQEGRVEAPGPAIVQKESYPLDGRVMKTTTLDSWVYSENSCPAFSPKVVAPCVYIIGLALPLSCDIPLLALGFLAMLASLSTFSGSYFHRVPLLVPALAFLGATALSIVFSADVGRSLRLSVHYLPAALLLLLISQFRNCRQTRVLFWCLSLFSLRARAKISSHF